MANDSRRYLVEDRGHSTPCWIWAGEINSQGYGVAAGYHAHRYVYWLLKGPLRKASQVHHLCRQRLCVNPDHLEAMAAQEHRKAHRKLTATAAREIRSAMAGVPWGMRLAKRRELAAKYGISPDYIYNILNGNVWREDAG